ncbi:hypothetical protein BGZ73_006730 [Actinomortierella ambigua]|nr:hypothetical protein BGZ73_006730 [Actinomortierella ambigua]
MNCLWSQSIAHNGHFVRHLQLRLDDGGPQVPDVLPVILQYCTSLTALTHTQPDYLPSRPIEIQKPSEDLIGKLIQRNPGIQVLSTDRVFCLQQSMGVLTQLKSLAFNTYGNVIAVEDVMYLLAAFPCLHELMISSTMASEPALSWTWREDRSPWQSWSSPLRRLSIMFTRGTTGMHLLLARCPNLEELHLPILETVEDATLDVLRSGQLSRLTTLISSKPVDNTVLPSLLQAFPSPQLQNLSLSEPSVETMVALTTYHSQTLVQVTIDCSRLHSPLLIFTHCKALKTLKISVNSRKMTDVRQLIKQPWACLQLEHLEMPLALKHLCKSIRAIEWSEAQVLFMEHLAALTRLRHVELWGPWQSPYEGGRDMIWSLENGFELLQGLSRLQVLFLGYRETVLEMADLEWMKERFACLRKLFVYKIGDRQLRRWLHEQWPRLNVVELEAMAITKHASHNR